MGLSNKMIVTDSQLTASSKLNEFSGANRGRIYMEKDGSLTGGWIPRLDKLQSVLYLRNIIGQ